MVIVDHGSRVEESNRTVGCVASLVQDLAVAPISVYWAHLGGAPPDLPTVLGEAAEHSSVVVVPYFLGPGNHVQRDIPKLVDEARARYPETSFRLAPPLGVHSSLAALILERAGLAFAQDSSPVSCGSDPKQCKKSDCPHQT